MSGFSLEMKEVLHDLLLPNLAALKEQTFFFFLTIDRPTSNLVVPLVKSLLKMHPSTHNLTYFAPNMLKFGALLHEACIGRCLGKNIRSLEPFLSHNGRSIDYRSLSSLAGSISKIKKILDSPLERTNIKSKPKEPKANDVMREFKAKDVTGNVLMKHFKSHSILPINYKLNRSQETTVKGFFNQSQIKQEWSIFRYEDIPGEKERSEKEELMNMDNDDMNDIEPEESCIIKSEHDMEMTKYDEDDDSNQAAEKVRKVQEFDTLPEVIFIGRCNVGKSSLLNQLFAKRNQKARKYAKVKQKAGYTVCMNFYNIGGMIRLVDSPGYGRKGKNDQGKLVLHYLENRMVLRQCYLLLDSNVGLNKYDEMIIESLVQFGVPFDVVFNKIDKIPNNRRIQHMEEVINRSVLPTLKIQPRYYFVSSIENKSGICGTGINELRYGMLRSCGISADSGKLTPIKKSTLEEEIVMKRKLKNPKMLVHMERK